MSKLIFITGATSGFGKSTAELFAKNGYRLIITGRRKERLLSLKAELESQNGSEVHLLCFDVRSQESTATAIQSLPEDWRNIDVLVNNAGLASGLDKVQDADLEDWNKMIDTNVKGLLYVSRAIIPWMINNKRGHVINVGSTAGKEVYEKAAVYCATKHAVDAISKGMRIDLLQHGIKVTQISPGAAETEFSLVRFHGDEQRAKDVYNGYEPMHAEDIADLIWFSANLPKHLCINDMVVTSTSQANSFYIHRKDS